MRIQAILQVSAQVALQAIRVTTQRILNLNSLAALHLLVLVMSHHPLHQIDLHQVHLVKVRVDPFIHHLLLVNPLQSVPPRVRAHRLSQVLALRLNLIAKQGLLLEALQVTQARVPL